MIKEAGIMAYNKPLVYKCFYDKNESIDQPVCTSTLMKQFLIFSESIYESVERFVSGNIIIILKKKAILSNSGSQRELYGFIIADRIKEKLIENFIPSFSKILTLLLNRFLYDYKNPINHIANLTHFENFKDYIDKVCSIFNDNFHE